MNILKKATLQKIQIIRINMMNKRMSKLDFALKEIPDEDKAVTYGQDDLSRWYDNSKLGIY